MPRISSPEAGSDPLISPRAALVSELSPPPMTAGSPKPTSCCCHGSRVAEGFCIESRLDGVERERVRRKLGAKKPVLKYASAAALHELKRGGSVIALQKKFDQRVVNVALVGQKIRLQPRELQLRAQTFNPVNSVTEFRFCCFALAVLQRDLAQ